MTTKLTLIILLELRRHLVRSSFARKKGEASLPVDLTSTFPISENSSSLAATISFVDLTGSKRASQILSEGTRLKKGCHINRSLLTLGTIIRKLSKLRNAHIPYRGSKLTHILQNSLGGNARTTIICTMSPTYINIFPSTSASISMCLFLHFSLGFCRGRATFSHGGVDRRSLIENADSSEKLEKKRRHLNTVSSLMARNSSVSPDNRSDPKLEVRFSSQSQFTVFCVKELSTNAHVNVVMSDKILVKHLQRELARLESELKSLGLNHVANDSTALLEKKELLIKKMDKETKYLTQ
ncbi:unnamed protein product, partial [Vitis vinifera]